MQAGSAFNVETYLFMLYSVVFIILVSLKAPVWRGSKGERRLLERLGLLDAAEMYQRGKVPKSKYLPCAYSGLFWVIANTLLLLTGIEKKRYDAVIINKGPAVTSLAHARRSSKTAGAGPSEGGCL